MMAAAEFFSILFDCFSNCRFVMAVRIGKTFWVATAKLISEIPVCKHFWLVSGFVKFGCLNNFGA